MFIWKEYPQKNIFFPLCTTRITWNRALKPQSVDLFLILKDECHFLSFNAHTVQYFTHILQRHEAPRVWNIFDVTKHLGPRCSYHYHSHQPNHIIIIIIIASVVFVISVCLYKQETNQGPVWSLFWKRLGGWRRGRWFTFSLVEVLSVILPNIHDTLKTTMTVKDPPSKPQLSSVVR